MVKNPAAVDRKGFRAQLEQDRSGAVGRCDESDEREADHEVSNAGIGLRA